MPARHLNNFDLVRILAALCVLISHQHALTGLREPVVLNAHSLGGFGVLVFFSISGFLVAQSWANDPHVWRFTTRRLLRIWPGYAVAIVMTAVVLGPLVSTLPMRDYFRHPLFMDYFSNLSFRLRDQLPLQFTGSALPAAVNGSLWTIPLELKCYLALAVLGLGGLLRVVWLLPCMTLLAAGSYFFVLVPGGASMLERFHWTAEDHYLLQFGLFFFAGASLFHFRIHSDSRRTWTALVLGWSAGATALASGNPLLALWLLVPVSVIVFGHASTPYLCRAGRFGDLSYGLYIYAFPVQQTLIWLHRDQLPWGGLLALSIISTAALAFASWHLVEKRALQLKPSRRPT